MYATLMQFAADGGGDGPEDVNQALHDAIQKVSWSTDQSAYKVVFLVGDAPPHMDYQDDVKYPEIVAAAAAKGIVVNTIQCGGCKRDRRAVAAHRGARPRPILHGRASRQRRRDRDAVRCGDRDAGRAARRDAPVLRLRRGARAHEREGRGDRASCTKSCPSTAQARRGVFNATRQRRCEPRRRAGARARRHERPRRSRRRAAGRAAGAARRPVARRAREGASRKPQSAARSCSSRSARSRASAMRSSRASSRSSAVTRTRSTGRSTTRCASRRRREGVIYESGPKF